MILDRGIFLRPSRYSLVYECIQDIMQKKTSIDAYRKNANC
jgi:hypothetical protein